MTTVEDLDVFKLAHQLALKTYAMTKKFPKEETFSLVDQMRRAATSVGMNLMEGAMRLGSRESAICRYRPRISWGSLLSTDSCQRFEIHFHRDLPRITSWLRPCDSNAFPAVTES